MRKLYDPMDLEVSAQPDGNGKWKWAISGGNSAPIKTGVVTGTRAQALATGHEERWRLISKGHPNGTP
jgi:hypothetical protein